MKNLLPDYIIENYKNNKTSGSFDAFTMFVDISGFTPMTEKLMKGGKEGAEILSNILKDVFKSTVKYVYQNKGFISNFAGDAFTAIFQINDSNYLQEAALELLNCSNKILKEVQKNALHETKFGDFKLKVQIGISFGKINWAIIGDTYKSYYIRGEAIKGCVESENNAKANEIVIDERFKKLLDKNITLKDNIKKGYYIVKNFKGINTFKQETINKPSILSITKELFSKKFLPVSVFNVKDPGEFRYVVSVFISFRDLYKSEETDNFFNIILNKINDCSGYLKEIDFGDKGGVIVCYIGAPISFEDNIERALNFILSIQYEILKVKNFSELNFKVGITYGKVYAGIIGGEERCQYAMVGDMVNLAARFMEKASWGEILTDEAIFQKAKENFQIESIGRHQFKGLSEEINTYRLSNKKTSETRDFYSGIMVGRESEIKQMHIFVNKIFKDKNAGVLFVNGEAGIGKSRLVNEFRKDLEKKYNVNWFYCPAQKTLNHSLDPFKYFFKNYFNQFTNDSIEMNKIVFNKKIDQLVNNLQIIINPDIETIINELKRTRSIIGALLDLHWENSLYEQLEPQLKFENTLLAIFNFILAECTCKPVIIELEDAHWLDNDSIELLNALSRNITEYPLTIIFTSRDLADGKKFKFGNEYGIPHQEINLNYLSNENIKSFVENILNEKVNKKVISFLKDKTDGNPYFLEQLVLDIKERGFWKKENGNITISLKDDFEIPSSINGVLISRFDRLKDDIKNVIQTASILGREFDTNILLDMLKDESDIEKKIKIAEEENIWIKLSEHKYIFKHVLLQDSIYNLQMKSKLNTLHLIAAESIEHLYMQKSYSKTVEQYSYHLGVGSNIINENNNVILRKKQLENRDTKKHVEKYYKLQKGMAYDYKKKFMNERAINKCDIILELSRTLNLKENELEFLMTKGKLLQHIGEIDETINIFENAINIGKKLNNKKKTAESYNLLGYTYEQISDYNKSLIYFEKALKMFKDLENKTGISRTLGNIGNINRYLGNYDSAMQNFNSALAIYEKLNDKEGIASITGKIGIIFVDKGDFETGISHYNKQLKIFTESDYKMGVLNALGNLGVAYYYQGKFKKALKSWREKINESQKLGYKKGTAIDLGNMGNVYHELGNYEKALNYFNKSLIMYKEIGDKNGVSLNFGNMANSLREQKKIDKALDYYDKAISIGKELGVKYWLSGHITNKGILFFQIQKYNEAKTSIEEGLKIAEEVERQDCLFFGRVILHKIEFLTGNKNNAIKNLKKMLLKSENEGEIAEVNFEIYTLLKDNNNNKEDLEKYRKSSLSLYEKLYSETPRIEYKNQIKKLSSS